MQRVLLLGKSNVGKSSLFNCLLGRHDAITADAPHTTRDFKQATLAHRGRTLLLTDSSGLGSSRDLRNDPLLKSIDDRFWKQVRDYDLILFVVDLHNLDDEDRSIARRLRRLLSDSGGAAPTCILCANKADLKPSQEKLNRTYHLGFGEPLLVSCKTLVGIPKLRARLEGWASDSSSFDAADFLYTLSVLGRPNVGKSTLLNALADRDEALVSDKLGTTRDAVARVLKTKRHGVRLIDTAGLWRFKRKRTQIEKLSMGKTIDAINKSEVCLVVLDALEGITEQDKKIIDLVIERRKSIFLAVNKVDLLGGGRASWADLRRRMDYQLPQSSRLRVLRLSARNQPNRARLHVLRTSDELFKERHTEFKTSELNALLARLMGSHDPSTAVGGALKLYYGVQVQKSPLKIRIYVNNRKLVASQFERYIQRGLMESKNIKGSRIELEFINRERRP